MNAHVSDLFFNFSHDKRDALYKEASRSKNPSVDPAEERQAVLHSATEFAAMVEGGFGIKISPEALADDFMARV